MTSTKILSEAGETAPGPLAGVRVLDLTSVVLGPLATQILGEASYGEQEIASLAARGIVSQSGAS